MPYGFAGGLAAGFGQGVDSGTQIAEARARQTTLRNEQIRQQSDTVTGYINDGLKTLSDWVSSTPQRTPQLEQGIEAYKAQLLDSANLLMKVNPQAGQQALQKINTIIPSLKTASEAASASATADFEGKMTFVNSLAGPQATPPLSQQPEQQQVAGIPGPGATPPLPPQSSLIQQAQAEPQQPAVPEVAVPQPAAQPSPTPVGQRPNTEQEIIRRRAIESVFPPTEEEKKMTEAKVKRFGELEERASSAIELHGQLQQARQLLNDGIYTGLGADWKLKASKAVGFDPEKIRRTESFMAIMGRQIGPRLKEFGSGTGVSDRDVQVVEQFIGKDINLSEAAIRDILDIGQRSIKGQLDRFNKIAPPESQIQLPVQLPEAAAAGAQDGGLVVGEDGWVDLGGGIRLRKKVQ